jgi:hypothetical protein
LNTLELYLLSCDRVACGNELKYYRIAAYLCPCLVSESLFDIIDVKPSDIPPKLRQLSAEVIKATHHHFDGNSILTSMIVDFEVCLFSGNKENSGAAGEGVTSSKGATTGSSSRTPRPSIAKGQHTTAGPSRVESPTRRPLSATSSRPSSSGNAAGTGAFHGHGHGHGRKSMVDKSESAQGGLDEKSKFMTTTLLSHTRDDSIFR